MPEMRARNSARSPLPLPRSLAGRTELLVRSAHATAFRHGRQPEQAAAVPGSGGSHLTRWVPRRSHRHCLEAAIDEATAVANIYADRDPIKRTTLTPGLTSSRGCSSDSRLVKLRIRAPKSSKPLKERPSSTTGFTPNKPPALVSDKDATRSYLINGHGRPVVPDVHGPDRPAVDDHRAVVRREAAA